MIANKRGVLIFSLVLISVALVLLLVFFVNNSPLKLKDTPVLSNDIIETSASFSVMGTSSDTSDSLVKDFLYKIASLMQLTTVRFEDASFKWNTETTSQEVVGTGLTIDHINGDAEKAIISLFNAEGLKEDSTNTKTLSDGYAKAFIKENFVCISKIGITQDVNRENSKVDESTPSKTINDTNDNTLSIQIRCGMLN